MRSTLPLLFSVLTAGCAPASAPGAPASTARPEAARLGVTEEGERGPSGAPREALAWADFTPAAFAKATVEKRYVVIDGSAEWCHWCHVMEATTYHDPEVRKLLDAHFVAVKVDVDKVPDFQERYENWGWPATVLMTAGGVELGKYRGYLAPEKFADILRAVLEGARVDAGAGAGVNAGTSAGPGVMTEAEIAGAASRAEKQLDGFWDEKQGSWGRFQKVPLYGDNAWALARAATGDEPARRRVLFALDRQRGIIDPLWGGICQYSTDGDWMHPHFEKLMTFQAGAIDNYAAAYALTRDPAWLQTAQLVRGFVDRFMTTPEGAFSTTMDADLNAHEPGKPFVTGREYYAKTDAERRALGIPRVDTGEYARENGLAIAAYVTLFEASGDASALVAAERAAARILATHATQATHGAAVTHAARTQPGEPLYLADNAAFGFALARLYEATSKPEHLRAAAGIARFLATELFDQHAGGFFAATPDPNAVGVFAARRKPFEDNVMAVRFFAKLAKLGFADMPRDVISRTLPGILAQQAIEERGRMLGDLLLAVDETRGLR